MSFFLPFPLSSVKGVTDYNSIIRTPEMWPPRIEATLKCPKYLCSLVQIHPWNEATPLIKTLGQVPRVAGLEGVHCIPLQGLPWWDTSRETFLGVKDHHCTSQFVCILQWNQPLLVDSIFRTHIQKTSLLGRNEIHTCHSANAFWTSQQWKPLY